MAWSISIAMRVRQERPPMALLDGITGSVDAGSGGANNIDQVAATAAALPG